MRHAQKHWLEIQADEAVRRALVNEDQLFNATFRLGKLSNLSADALAAWRDSQLNEVAKLLVQTELLHREIVRRDHQKIAGSKCGSEDILWKQCWDCGGDGTHDAYEEDPSWYLPGDTRECDTCDGEGGWWQRVPLQQGKDVTDVHESTG